jgi:predicted RNA-binding protein (virulence factor B family)
LKKLSILTGLIDIVRWVMKKKMSKQRKEKLQEILKLLSENGGKMNFVDLFAKMVLKYGTTKETFWSYLGELESSGLIKVPGSIDILTGNEIKLIEEDEK